MKTHLASGKICKLSRQILKQSMHPIKMCYRTKEDTSHKEPKECVWTYVCAVRGHSVIQNLKSKCINCYNSSESRLGRICQEKKKKVWLTLPFFGSKVHLTKPLLLVIMKRCWPPRRCRQHGRECRTRSPSSEKNSCLQSFRRFSGRHTEQAAAYVCLYLGVCRPSQRSYGTLMGLLIPPRSIPLFLFPSSNSFHFILFFNFFLPLLGVCKSVSVLWCKRVPSILRRLLVAITVTSPRRQPPVCADGWLFSTQTHMCTSYAARQRMWLVVNQFVMRMEECEGSTGKGVTASLLLAILERRWQRRF